MSGRILLLLLLLTGVSIGQDLRSKELPNKGLGDKSSPDARVSKQAKAMFGVFGTEVLADGVVTRVLYQRHYDEIDPLAKPFTHAGVPGQIGASLLGGAAIAGAWWALRRTHHDRIAMHFLRSVTAAEGANVGRQFSILRTSQK